MTVANYLERVLRFVWQQHFRIPESLYWTGIVVFSLLGAAVSRDGSDYLIGFILVVACVAGIARWHRDRNRCRGALVVARFREGGGTQGHADEAQRIIIDSLRSKLGQTESLLVQPVPVVIGSDERVFAEKLQRRLRAGFVLHGRLASRPEGGWSVLPRILEPAVTVSHYDTFTRDVTPARPSFGPIVSSLPAQHGVRDDEFPFDFCRDLEALMRSIVGVVAAAFGDDERAVPLLREALAISPESTSWLVDGLRVSLAQALCRRGDVSEGLALVESRLNGGNPSPHLLRSYGFLAWWYPDPNAVGQLTEAEEAQRRARIESAYRKALAIRSDPQRDMTAFNFLSYLVLQPPEDAEGTEQAAEADELLMHLASPQSEYSRTWYVRRTMGLMAWRRAVNAWRQNDDVLAQREAKEAARWYSRAIRVRPRLKLMGIQRSWPFVQYTRYSPSAIMQANAKDAHQLAGHRFRARWHEWRFQRLRRILLRRGRRHFEEGNVQFAYANYDWCIVGRDDYPEGYARVHAATSLWLAGQRDEAVAVWHEALEHNPASLLIRANLADTLSAQGIEHPVPGDEPTDQAGVGDLLQRLATSHDPLDAGAVDPIP
jgi:tetratricopeptide (TPR) repeat protein